MTNIMYDKYQVWQISGMTDIRFEKNQVQQVSDMTRIIHDRTCQQEAVGDVVGKRFVVEKTGAHDRAGLPGCEGAASQGGDGGIGLAKPAALLFRLKLVLEHDERLVSTALRIGPLWQGSRNIEIFSNCKRHFYGVFLLQLIDNSVL